MLKYCLQFIFQINGLEIYSANYNVKWSQLELDRIHYLYLYSFKFPLTPGWCVDHYFNSNVIYVIHKHAINLPSIGLE